MKKYNLDDLDVKILKFLSKDGRASFTDIASKLSVAVSTVSTRYNDLVKHGFLEIVGRIVPQSVGYEAYATILLKVAPKDQTKKICDQLINIPEVNFLAVITGDYDLEINVVCKDMKHLSELMNNKIFSINGVMDTKTNLYLDILKIGIPELEITIEK
jgi:Lrp/AsnC family transcriptional regulator, regulator for asnA, asnC and gidA